MTVPRCAILYVPLFVGSAINFTKIINHVKFPPIHDFAIIIVPYPLHIINRTREAGMFPAPLCCFYHWVVVVGAEAFYLVALWWSQQRWWWGCVALYIVRVSLPTTNHLCRPYVVTSPSLTFWLGIPAILTLYSYVHEEIALNIWRAVASKSDVGLVKSPFNKSKIIYGAPQWGMLCFRSPTVHHQQHGLLLSQPCSYHHIVLYCSCHQLQGCLFFFCPW